MITTLKLSGLTATINHNGAELTSLSDSHNNEYIWNGNPEFWGKHSPVLFPIVGTLKKNSYIYNNKTYFLSRHGFARDREFELLSNNETQAVFSLKADADTLSKYPFHFELQIIYTLKARALEVSYKVINLEKFTIPFSIGAHPAFALDRPFENYSLSFENPERLVGYILENDLLSEETVDLPLQNGMLPLSYELFEQDASIFKSMSSKRITLFERSLPVIDFKFNNFPNFGIWTKLGAPFICLEPWAGYSDTINTNGDIMEKEAIQLLAAQDTFECSLIIEIL